MQNAFSTIVRDAVWFLVCIPSPGRRGPQPHTADPKGRVCVRCIRAALKTVTCGSSMGGAHVLVGRARPDSWRRGRTGSTKRIDAPPPTIRRFLNEGACQHEEWSFSTVWLGVVHVGCGPELEEMSYMSNYI